MYERYAAVMGGILEHLDVGSYPTDDMLPEATEDLQSEAESWFVSGWWSVHGNQSVQVTDLLPIAISEGSIVAVCPRAEPQNSDTFFAACSAKPSASRRATPPRPPPSSCADCPTTQLRGGLGIGWTGGARDDHAIT